MKSGCAILLAFVALVVANPQAGSVAAGQLCTTNRQCQSGLVCGDNGNKPGDHRVCIKNVAKQAGGGSQAEKSRPAIDKDEVIHRPHRGNAPGAKTGQNPQAKSRPSTTTQRPASSATKVPKPPPSKPDRNKAMGQHFFNLINSSRESRQSKQQLLDSIKDCKAKTNVADLIDQPDYLTLECPKVWLKANDGTSEDKTPLRANLAEMGRGIIKKIEDTKFSKEEKQEFLGFIPKGCDFQGTSTLSSNKRRMLDAEEEQWISCSRPVGNGQGDAE
ncbi:hypothetical protein QQS21_005470 [Conoideocrella luteorostrata]|uniref:Uncharacterized protein n=1 Tax=Conoideocrella luteorostrata TaxID=1105319 RepID=A0AAJ0CQF7_9HYPO|nr:hypothetical protein QQS21_005470 [Conoideocrella luteorostrata]